MQYFNTDILNFRIRLTEEEDIPLILHLIQELAAYENLLDEVAANEETMRLWLFERQSAQVLIGEYEGEPVGYILFFYNFSTFLGRSGLYLEDLYVRPQMRGKGLGKAFLRHLAQKAVKEGCGRVEWCCLDWNAPSIAFYQSLGAFPMEDWTNYRLTGEALNRLAGS